MTNGAPSRSRCAGVQRGDVRPVWPETLLIVSEWLKDDIGQGKPFNLTAAMSQVRRNRYLRLYVNVERFVIGHVAHHRIRGVRDASTLEFYLRLRAHDEDESTA